MKINKPALRKCIVVLDIMIIAVFILILILQAIGILSPLWTMAIVVLSFVSMISIILIYLIDRNSDIKKAEFKPIYYLPIAILTIIGIITIFFLD